MLVILHLCWCLIFLKLKQFSNLMKTITLEVGNTSWWKNLKYRKEAAQELRKIRVNNKNIKLIKKYRIEGSNTIIYGDYKIR